MSHILSANPAVRKREEVFRIQHRLRQLEAGIDRALEMAKEVGSNAPSQPTAEDAWDLAEALARAGTEGLPKGSHVETQAVDTTTPPSTPLRTHLHHSGDHRHHLPSIPHDTR
jgi:hypothetical protein